MIQFNLLPDIKIEYIKTQKLKRVVILISIAAVAVAVGLLIIFFSFSAVQKKHISDLDKDIAALRTELEETPDLTRILSIQNQLNVLPDLYNGRPAVDRVPQYIDQTTPSGVGIERLIVDFSASTVEIKASAPTLQLMNSFADTLKYTTYRIQGEEGDQALQAFGAVVLSEFARDAEGASFTLRFSFDPTIFDIQQSVSLTVPNLVTTRAQAPSADLFKGTPSTEGVQ